MSYFSYIDDNQSNNNTNNNTFQPLVQNEEKNQQLVQNEKKKSEGDTYDKQLEQLNNSMFDWNFNESRRNLGVGIYGNLTKDTFYQSSRNSKYDTSTLHNTSNNRINAHIFKSDINNQDNPFHQTNIQRNDFIETENQLRNLAINNHSIMKKKIKKKTSIQNYINPRQNKYSNHPSQQNSYNETLLAENNLRYGQLKKKNEETTNPTFIQSKRNELMQPRQNTITPTQENNTYIDRFWPTNSNNPSNRLL
jgi:hypothetical protein